MGHCGYCTLEDDKCIRDGCAVCCDCGRQIKKKKVAVTDKIIATRLQEIEARADAATEGPWYKEDVSERDVRRTGWGVCIRGTWNMVLESVDPNNEHDADFIAHARTDIPVLIAEIRRLQRENFDLREQVPPDLTETHN